MLQNSSKSIGDYKIFWGRTPTPPATGFGPTALNHTPSPNEIPGITPVVARCSFYYECTVIKHS